MSTNDGVGSGSLLSRIVASEWIPPGLFFIAVGTASLWISRDYPLGSLHRMGPGFFPRMLSFGMIALGAAIVLKGLPDLATQKGSALRLDRSVWLVPASMAVFGLAIEPLGLVTALVLTIAVAGIAHRQAQLKEIALSTGFLIVLSVVIFVVILKLPLRLWPSL